MLSLVEALWRYLLARRETIAGVASFGAGSVYWLMLAFVISSASYGRLLMTLQAIVLLVTSSLTFRTQDLFYNLLMKHGVKARRAWRMTNSIELFASIAAFLTAFIAVSWTSGGGAESQPALWIYLALASLAVLQQASGARLRQSGHQAWLVTCDLISCLLWACAIAALIADVEREPIEMLLIGAIPQACKSVLLLGRAAFLDDPDDGVASVSIRHVARFLAEGQVVNVIKNGATSIEVIILSFFASPSVIAMYRLSKSAQGAGVAAANIAFQQGLHSIAKSGSPAEQLRLSRQVRKRGIRIALASFPLACVVLIAYAIQKPEIDVYVIMAINVGVFLAFLLAVMLQGSFMILSLNDRQMQITFAFGLSMIAFITISLLLFEYPSVYVVILASVLGLYIRYRLLNIYATRVLRPVS